MVFCFLVSGAIVHAEPCAPLVKLTADGEKLLSLSGKSKLDWLKEFPANSAVGIPVYPGAEMSSWLVPMMEGCLQTCSMSKRESRFFTGR